MRRFDNRQAQKIMVCVGLLFALIGVAGLAQPLTRDKVQGCVWILFGVFSAWRGWRTSNVILGAQDVELRSILRTRRVPLRELESATVGVGRVGLSGFDREYLVLHSRIGDATPFKELNSKPSATGETVVQVAAREITDALNP